MPEPLGEFNRLVNTLKDDGKVEVPIDPAQGRNVKAVRNQLKEAAHRANVRIAMKTHKDPELRVVATVLSPEDAELQYERDTIFRAVNRIRSGLEILTAGTIDVSPYELDIADLTDIADELEDAARHLIGGATE